MIFFLSKYLSYVSYVDWVTQQADVTVLYIHFYMNIQYATWIAWLCSLHLFLQLSVQEERETSSAVLSIKETHRFSPRYSIFADTWNYDFLRSRSYSQSPRLYIWRWTLNETLRAKFALHNNLSRFIVRDVRIFVSYFNSRKGSTINLLWCPQFSRWKGTNLSRCIFRNKITLSRNIF